MDSNKLEQMRDIELTDDFMFAIYLLNIQTLPCQGNEYGIEVYLAKLLERNETIIWFYIPHYIQIYQNQLFF